MLQQQRASVGVGGGATGRSSATVEGPDGGGSGSGMIRGRASRRVSGHVYGGISTDNPTERVTGSRFLEWDEDTVVLLQGCARV